MYPRYRSKSGYYIDDDDIDSYGVDHKNFSTRDELEYQMARQEKENEFANQNNINKEIEPKYWETAQEGKQVFNNVVNEEGNTSPENQNIYDYANSAIKGGMNLVKNYLPIRNMNATDKYKHALMNCQASQYGKGGADMVNLASNIKETYDIVKGINSIDSSQGDQYANKIGRLMGTKYPNEDCDELIKRYIKKFW
ncbi:MAG: hypothetical protein E7019_03830 [Alphaproteobacteria bacterium]|nr:hypothetical protein [Alphaproteobacteria bacterium]